jgi:hypothetical protein
VAGHIGEYFKKEEVPIKHIIALDPARPAFEYYALPISAEIPTMIVF